MKKYKTEEILQKVCVSITCDKCKKEYDDVMEMQEFLHYDNDAGYSSVFGDGNILRLDLCQHCTKELLGPFIRTEGNYIWDEFDDQSEIVEATKNVKMDDQHDHLNDLIDEDFAKVSSFNGDTE